MAHDVSRELRGRHGEWTKGGAAIHRLAGEAEKAAAAKPGKGDRVKYKTGSLGTVHHIDDKGTPHVVWDKGRGNPVRTPAHHLTKVEGEKQKAAAQEGAVRRLQNLPPIETPEQVAERWRQEKLKEIGPPAPAYKPPRQASSRGGVPAPKTGPKLPRGVPSETELKGKSDTQLAEMANIARGQGSYPGKELTLQRIRSEQIGRQQASAPKGTGEVKVTHRISGTGKHTYEITGTINGERFDQTPAIQSSRVAYSHASLTTLTDGQQVLSFHKSADAAAKGNPQIAKQYHSGARVIPITEKVTPPITEEQRAMIQQIQERQRAATEAENKATGRSGTTVRTDILSTPEPAEYLAKLRGGGVQVKSPSSLAVGETAIYSGGHSVTRTSDGWQATIGGKRKFYANNQAALLSVALRHGEH
jgi:hypothetical protein